MSLSTKILLLGTFLLTLIQRIFSNKNNLFGLEKSQILIEIYFNFSSYIDRVIIIIIITTRRRQITEKERSHSVNLTCHHFK